MNRYIRRISSFNGTHKVALARERKENTRLYVLRRAVPVKFPWLARRIIAIAGTPVLLFVGEAVEDLGFTSKQSKALLDEFVFDGFFYSPFISVYM